MKRREFLKKSAVLAAGITGLASIVSNCDNKDKSITMEIGKGNIISVDGLVLSEDTISVNYFLPLNEISTQTENDTTPEKNTKEKYNLIIKYANDTITTNNPKLYNKLKHLKIGDSLSIVLSSTYIIKKDENEHPIKKIYGSPEIESIAKK